MGNFGLRRKGESVKVGNLSTQAVETSDSVDSGKKRRRLLPRRRKAPATTTAVSSTPIGNVTVRTSAEVRVAAFAQEIERLRQARTKPVEPFVQNVSSATITLESSTRGETTTNSVQTRPAALRYSDDILSLSETKIANSQFQPVERNGLTAFRPEVISVANYSPLYADNAKSGHYSVTGKYIHLQQQILNIRKETLVQLLTAIEQWKPEKTQEVFDQVQAEFNKELSRTQRSVGYYDRFINALETSKENLDIRNVTPSKPGVLGFQSFMESNMQFSKLRQQYFSNTKMYLQLCADFKSVLENYSFALLDLVDSDRISDVSPIDIDNSYTTKDGFSFSVESIRSPYTAINASNSQHFSSFMNSLPQDYSDRVKLLVTLLSKEYRVSKNLSQTENSKPLFEMFSQGDTGSPFDNLVGIPGDTIFDSPNGTNSLSSLAQISLGQNSIILPLERKYVDSESSGKTFIPGSSYFFDTILASSNNKQFNTKPYVDYVDLFTKTTNTSIGLIRNLLELDDKKLPSSRLTPEVMLDSFLLSLKTSMDGLLTAKSINKDQGAAIALFSLANSDTQLKNMLFQFCIFAGIASYNKNDTKQVFINLAKELKTTQSISYARIIARLSVDLTDPTKLGVLQTYLQDLAQDIEDRVFLLVAGREIPRRNTATQKSQGITSDYSSLDVLGSVVPNLDRRVVFLNEGNIKTILMSIVTPDISGTTTLFKEFLNICNEITAAASINGTSSYLLPDDTGRTRYNFLSTSMQTLIVFEILSSLNSKYSNVVFKKSRYNDKVILDIDLKSNRFFTSIISQVTSRGLPNLKGSRAGTNSLASTQVGTSTPSVNSGVSIVSSQTNFSSINNATPQLSTQNQTPRSSRTISGGPTATAVQSQEDVEEAALTVEQIEFRNNLTSLRNQIGKENLILSNFIELFNEINNQLRNGKTIITNTFNDDTLKEFLSENSIVDLDIIKNPTQTRVSSYLLDEFEFLALQDDAEKSESSSNYESYIISDVPSMQLIRAMESLMQAPAFGKESMADERLRIVSVGIPTGLSKKLSERINTEKIAKESFFQRQSDVIRCNIYKRDVRYEDIVFKPKSFTFDLSLFLASQDVNNIEPRPGESFSQLLIRSKLTDFQNPKHKRKVTLSSIKEDATYSFLDDSEKEQMIANHVQSTLLENYMRLMTNMKLTEETFVDNDQFKIGANVNPNLVALVYSYIQDVYGVNLGNTKPMDLLKNDRMDATIQDVIRLVTYGSRMFDPKSVRDQIVSPKLFDRIFHIPISIDGFDVDVETTKQTNSGRQALLKNFVQDKLVEANDNTFTFDIKNTQNEVAFADFFVTVETDF